MIIGKIEDGLHPRISLQLAGTKKSEQLVTLVDTGFDWNIGLHYDFVGQLGLEVYDFINVEYANGKAKKNWFAAAKFIGTDIGRR